MGTVIGLIIVSGAGSSTRTAAPEPETAIAPEQSPDRPRRPAAHGLIIGLVTTAGLAGLAFAAFPEALAVADGFLTVVVLVIAGMFGLAMGISVNEQRSVLPVFALLGLLLAGSAFEFYSVFVDMSAYPAVAIGAGVVIIALALTMSRRRSARA